LATVRPWGRRVPARLLRGLTWLGFVLLAARALDIYVEFGLGLTGITPHPRRPTERISAPGPLVPVPVAAVVHPWRRRLGRSRRQAPRHVAGDLISVTQDRQTPLGATGQLLLGHGVSSLVGDPECQPSPSVPETPRTGSCQRFARNCATRNLTSPHHPTLGSAFHLHDCVWTRGPVRRCDPRRIDGMQEVRGSSPQRGLGEGCCEGPRAGAIQHWSSERR
jgi:hypothetical protein